MVDDLKIYHNPRCSKSRETLSLLREKGRDPQVVEYLLTPPTADELRAIVRMLGVRAHDIVRAKEPEYAEAGLSPESGDDEIIDAIVRFPRLLERPIVVRDGRAAIGRPPINVLDIIE